MCAMASDVPERRIAVTVVPRPDSSGSLCARSTMAAWASAIASLRWSSDSSGPRASPSRAAKRPTARDDAMSPPAAPPMPSATTSRCGPANAESWLSARTSPTSERAAKRSVRYMSGPQFQRGGANADALTDRERNGVLDFLIAQERAVGGAEILDQPVSVLGKDAAMPCRQEVVFDHHGARGRAPDQDGRGPQRHGRALERSGRDREVGGGWVLGGDVAGPHAGAGARGRRPLVGAAVGACAALPALAA